MAFEMIECLNAAKPPASKVPPAGIQAGVRKLGSRAGKEVRYIRLQIGAQLAKAVSLTAETQKILLLFGSGEDAGKVRVAVPATGGAFAAKRDKSGCYVVTINTASAEGLFSLTFETFRIERCEPIRPTNGQSPHFVFQASGDMLAVED